jgi:hypothetical protein
MSLCSNLVDCHTGIALGISYAQTRNLLTPMTIHAFWNSGVILLLTILQVYMGYHLYFLKLPENWFSMLENMIWMTCKGLHMIGRSDFCYLPVFGPVEYCALACMMPVVISSM